MTVLKIKFVVLLIVALLSYSCGQKGWSESEKRAFVKSCVKANKGKVSKETAEELCECMLYKMTQQHLTSSEAQKMKQEEIKEIAASCLSTMKNLRDNFVLYTTKDGKAGFSLKGWKEEEQSNFDLQCTDGEAHMGVYVHNIKDFKLGTTKKDILDMYVKSILSKRKNIRREAKNQIRNEKQTIYQVIYSADIDENRNIYSFNVVDFGEDTFVFVLFTALPSYGEEHLQDWNNILKIAVILK